MRGRGGYTPRGMRGGVRGVVRGGVHLGRGVPNGMRGGRGGYAPRARGMYTPRGQRGGGNFNNSQQQVASNTWKLQCFFCTDTVSTGKLNRNYYKLHLEAVHNISLNVEKLLNFTLSQQNVGEGGAITAGSSPLTAVANILSMKGITIQRTSDTGAASAPKPAAGAVIPETLINIKGITVQRVNDGSSQPQQSAAAADPPAPSAPSAAQMRQQEQAINRWANGCEHGCRLCKQKGKSFVSFTRQGLLKHLEQEHEATERDYKEEFKCINLITRASNMTCKECGNRVKRIPTSLNIHLKRHSLNLRSYWLKHLKPNSMSGVRANNVNGNQGRARKGAHVCEVAGCSRTFDSPTALALHNSWHQREKPAGEAEDGDEIEMEMELDPTAMLEVGIGDEPLEVELPEDADEDGKEGEGLKHSVNRMLGTEGENGVDDDDVKSEPPDPDDPDYDQLNTPEAIDIDENDVDDDQASDGNKTPVLEFPDFPDEEDEEVVNIDTPEPTLDWVNPIDDQVKADPCLPIPLPDCSNDPAGAPLPPMPDMPTVQPIAGVQDENTVDSDGAPPPPDETPPDNLTVAKKSAPPPEPASQPEPAMQPEPASQPPPQVTPSPHNSHPPSPHAAHQVPSPYGSQHSHSSPMGVIPSHMSPHASQNSPMAPPQSPMVPPQSPLVSQPSPMVQSQSPHNSQPPPIISQPTQMLPQPVVLPQHSQPVVISQHIPHPQPIPDPSFSYPMPPTAHSIPYTTSSVYPAPSMSYLPPHPAAPPPMSYLPPPHNPYPTSLPPQGRYIPYAPGQSTPIHTINDHVEPAYDGRLPHDYWETMSCTVNIDACPIYCCHVRAHQEIAEGRTDWKRPYGPPLHGTVGCSCCVNQ